MEDKETQVTKMMDERSLPGSMYDGSSMGDLDLDDDLDDEEEELLNAEEDRDLELARRESMRVWIWKGALVVTVIIVFSLIVFGTHRIVTNYQDDDFNDAYDKYAQSVSEGIHTRHASHQNALNTMANSYSGSASAYGDTFPFVTLADIEVQGHATRERAGIEVFSFSPYVYPGNQLALWKNYSTTNSAMWIEQSRATSLTYNNNLTASDYQAGAITPDVWGFDAQGNVEVLTDPYPFRSTFAPVWQQSPPPFVNWIFNMDWMAMAENVNLAGAMAELLHSVLGPVQDTSFMSEAAVRSNSLDDFHQNMNQTAWKRPHSVFNEPVYTNVNDKTSGLVGQLQGSLSWDFYLSGLLPQSVRGIIVVLENSCGQAFTYELDGEVAWYHGAGDLHDSSFNDMRRNVAFHDFPNPSLAAETRGHCVYAFAIYPTQTFEDEYKTNLPAAVSATVAIAFLVMIAAFGMYDFLRSRKNNEIAQAAARSNEIVSSLFPSRVRDKLYEQKKQEHEKRNKRADWKLKSVISNVDGKDWNEMFDSDDEASHSEPIADFFPETTIMFADLVGFTAWSSLREPTQVFYLLETLYSAFDEIAKQRRVFKVETVGDCYVAAAGLPEPRKDHAGAMARFARDCLYRMDGLLRKLEVTLGPDTGDLGMRFGLHSGTVTAGVLRGDRARFQLFGDTMNTASRMESTGEPNRIHVSQDTADLLRASGKGNWLTAREGMVKVKGKGMMATYWVAPVASRDGSSVTDSSVGSGDQHESSDNLRNGLDRLVKWNVEVMAKLLRQIEAQNDVNASTDTKTPPIAFSKKDSPVLSEVREVIDLPEFKGNPTRDPTKIQLSKSVLDQLNQFIATIASLYNDNPFHNFEHASHVTMACVKLLSRVVNPKLGDNQTPSMLHDYTYGITSDPLTQFACVYACIIHDVAHDGVPNITLVKENSQMAKLYKRSVAEQHSFNLAWNLFMDEKYSDLRRAVCKGNSELKRFRQITVNLLMATDVIDRDLNGFRNQRWEKAFGSKAGFEEPEKDRVNRKATIVIEHLIQASDVAHTMQHWHVYRKWDKRLFIERYGAYVSQRTQKDPSLGWYEGELAFFDFYVIPLAKKLADCEVFGVASSELLDYAKKNRHEWEGRGREVVAEMLDEAKDFYQRKMLPNSMQAEGVEG